MQQWCTVADRTCRLVVSKEIYLTLTSFPETTDVTATVFRLQLYD